MGFDRGRQVNDWNLISDIGWRRDWFSSLRGGEFPGGPWVASFFDG
jgi:hypothetical protein